MQPQTSQSTDPGPAPDEVVELHWMYEPDLARSADGRSAVPALCGARFLPDEALAGDITSGRTTVRYVDCQTCEIVLELDVDARAIA